jgi:hypothetical protein
MSLHVVQSSIETTLRALMRIERGNVLVSENPQTKKDGAILRCSGLAASIRYAHTRHGVVACSLPPALAARLRFGLQQVMFRKRKRMNNQHIGHVQSNWSTK